MSDKIIDWYILFLNHTEGMEMYNYLRSKDLKVKISPAPRALTVCCGMSILVDNEDIDEVRAAVESSNIEYDRIEDLPRQINPKRDLFC